MSRRQDTTPDLVLLTAGYPFDGSEAVISAELDVIAPRFRRVFLLPSRTGMSRCELPANASVVELDPGDFTRADKARVLRSRNAAEVLRSAFATRSNGRSYLRHLRTYLDILARNLLRAEQLQGWIHAERLAGALFYDYWFENSTLALAVLRKNGVIDCAISRAHRFDVFDEAWGTGRVPFREYKARHLDAIFAVSNDGAVYLREKLANARDKVRVSHLGVPTATVLPEPDSGPPLVVSCSTLIPRKQVDRIPAVLRALGAPVRWVHFGDGPERGRIEAQAASLPLEVEWELRGWVDNATVHEFYRTRGVAALVSLSASEGVPVSMMEAQSYGIPIVALGVGGIEDLVTDETGILLRPDASTDAVATALATALQPGHFDPAAIRAAFKRFDAAKNYPAFADAILSIWRDNADTAGR